MKHKKLREIPGEKIRWQYFNEYLYMAVALSVLICLCMLTFSLQTGEFAKAEWIELAETFFTFSFVFFYPFVLLSVLNRFFFGKIICVLTEDALYYPDGWVLIRDIQSVTYDVDIIGRHWSGCSAHITGQKINGKKIDIQLKHAPFYLLGRIKAHNPDATVGLHKNSKFFIVFLLIAVFIAPLIAASLS